MMAMQDSTFTFDRFTLSISKRSLFADGEPVRLGARALELLILLVEKAGELVTKEQLMQRAWPDATVDENAMRVHLSALRKVLGETADGISFIQNETGRGYRWVIPVSVAGAQAAPVPTASPRPSYFLPASLGRIIGRDEVVHGLSELFPDRRLVTIAGPGGIGKTTVALAVAHRVANEQKIAGCFIDLAPLASGTLVVSALSSQLGIAVSGSAEQAIVAALADETVLIVFDNCEHVVDAVARLAETILQGALGVNILVTSREPLRAAGESIFRLQTLEVPAYATGMTTREAREFSAVQLFCNKAEASSSGFELTDSDVPAVLDICSRLDGIPLALEMAASRMDLLNVQEMARRLDDRFTVLTRGRRTAMPRQQTLRATLDWSHELLSDTEKAVFRRLSVFRSSFELDSAIAVCLGPGLEDFVVFDALTALVEKSLVTMDRRDRSSLYRLLDTTRFYAAEKLGKGAEFNETMQRHGQKCLKLFSSEITTWDGKNPAQWLAVNSWRVDDLRAVFDWAFTSGDHKLGLDLVVASASIWFHLSLPSEYLAIARRAMASISGTDLVGSAAELELLATFGHALWHTSGPTEDMNDAFKRAVEIADELDLQGHKLRAVWGLWARAILFGNYHESLSLAEGFKGPAYDTGELANIQTADHMLALSHHFIGNQEESLRLLMKVIAGDDAPVRANHTNHAQVDGKTAVLALLMRITWLQGDSERALELAKDCAEDALALDHDLSICYGLAIGCIPVAMWCGERELADEWNRDLVRRATKRGLRHWQAWSDGFAAILTGTNVFPRDATAMQAEVFASLTPAALSDELLERLETKGSLWCGPEFMRIAAMRADSTAEASREALESARAMAKHQGAVAWERRIEALRASDGNFPVARRYAAVRSGQGTED
ncbi:helix-turn-helix transcriptional regulator [Rhizobium herbae]|uniref:Helix-turn-helix transcriptional regulator n=1 Tax=Rhizobium herbae TaxID=508661 RepID=A0ABS7HBX8_9HYPH|nr:winged helix-turn-helix domain-containing protein [Rhizobium herbae]MBW9064721.1 helix-turn-helix transcriptional regulator [Rhizobium herbae]